MHPTFDLTADERQKLWNQLFEKFENYYSNTSSLAVSPDLNLENIQNFISKCPIGDAIEPHLAMDFVIEGLSKFAVHTPHPMYYGLYNPRTTFPSILGDAIGAAFNPQLAAWSHAPFANEVENYVIREFGEKFGFTDNCDGTFASGGAEANLTAVLVALCSKFPDYLNNGLQSLSKIPVFYASSESHHSFVKAARTAGLGIHALKFIPVNGKYKMDIEKLKSQIQSDISDGFEPFMVIATAGTTGAGIIDPINEIGKIANQYKIWFHVDAAYGGAAILNTNIKHVLSGIEKADSITFDAHKWLSVPMAASLFLTSHQQILDQTFRISTHYMPKDAEGMEVIDPYTHSIQWSRRFTGLKLYMSLLTFGWDGYDKVIQHQIDMGNLLRLELIKNNWTIYNETELPVICFSDKSLNHKQDFARFFCSKIIESGKAWISAYKIGNDETLRACITNYSTTEYHIKEMIELLNQFRNEFVKLM